MPTPHKRPSPAPASTPPAPLSESPSPGGASSPASAAVLEPRAPSRSESHPSPSTPPRPLPPIGLSETGRGASFPLENPPEPALPSQTLNHKDRQAVESLIARAHPMDFARLAGPVFSDLAFRDPCSWTTAVRLGAQVRTELVDDVHRASPGALKPLYARILSSIPFHTGVVDPHMQLAILSRIAALRVFVSTFQ